jgi:ubiquinone/menaquinone biosynthesis C-methylase UbiE
MKKNNWEGFWLDESKRDLLININSPKRWEDLVWKLTFEQWKSIFDSLAPGFDLLECGCGAANVSRYMAINGYKPTVIDYTDAGINLAKNGFRRLNLEASYVLGDINKLPFEDNSFDIVFSGGVLEYFENYEIPMSEMTRVLRPNGVFAANMVPRKFSIQTIADWQRTLAHSLKAVSQGNFKKALKRIRLVPKNYNINNATLDDYKKILEDLGVINLETRCITPFPLLSLPNVFQMKYVEFISKNLDLWKKFNDTDKPWKRHIGISYMVFGIKSS